MAQVFFYSFFFGSRFLCVRSVHKPFFSSAHDQDINSLKVYKKGGCNIPNTIMYILLNPCIINYDSNIFPRSSQIKPNFHIIQYKYWVKLAIFSSTVKLDGKSKIVQRRCSQTLPPFEVKIQLDHWII